MDIEQKKQQLEEYGKILMGPGGFFEAMPEDQKEIFGKALELIAEMKAYEMVKEGFEINLHLPSINLGSLFSVTPRVSYREEYHEEPWKCPTCMSDPCMCVADGTYEVKEEMPMDEYVEPMPTEEWKEDHHEEDGEHLEAHMLAGDVAEEPMEEPMMEEAKEEMVEPEMEEPKDEEPYSGDTA